MIVVTSDPVAGPRLSALGAQIVPEAPLPGGPTKPPRPSPDGSQHPLNAALLRGAAVAARRWPGTGLAALTADLPALRPAELAAALRAAAGGRGSGRGVRAGRRGRGHDDVRGGTRRGVPADVRRGVPGAACRRRCRELALDGIAGLRQDVDTPDDLRAAVALGVGPRTAEVAAELLAEVSARAEPAQPLKSGPPGR